MHFNPIRFGATAAIPRNTPRIQFGDNGLSGTVRIATGAVAAADGRNKALSEGDLFSVKDTGTSVTSVNLVNSDGNPVSGGTISVGTTEMKKNSREVDHSCKSHIAETCPLRSSVKV